jgi:hypothetical protein
MELFGHAGIVPSPWGLEPFMRRKKASTESFIEIFWTLIRENPKLAAAVAFELGVLAGGVVRNSAETKEYLKNQAIKVPQAISDAMPPRLSGALTFLPAPKLQPRKRPDSKRSSSRKAKRAA